LARAKRICAWLSRETATGIHFGGTSSREINAVKSEASFEFLDLWRRSDRRRRWRSFDDDGGVSRGSERRIAIVAHITGDGNGAGLRVGGVKSGVRLIAGDFAGGGRVAVSELAAVGTGGV